MLSFDVTTGKWKPATGGGGGSGQLLYGAIVAPTGGNFTSVRAAYAMGVKSVFVRNGIYEETGTLTITSDAFTIVGESRDGAIIRFPTGYDGVQVYANGTSITNVTIDTRTNGGAAAYVVGDGKAPGSPDTAIGNHNSLHHCRVLGPNYTFAVFVAGAATSSGAQTLTYFANGDLQIGNSITDCILESAWTGDSFSFSLQKNGKFNNNLCLGGRIAFYMQDGSKCEGNEVVDSVNHGIFVAAPFRDINVAGNVISSCASSGINIQNQLEHPITGKQGLRGTFYGNVITGAGFSGITINSAMDCTFSNNTIDTPAFHGIYVQEATDNLIIGNAIRNPNEMNDAVGSGIYLLVASGRNVIEGNSIRDDRAVPKMSSAIAERETSDCPDLVISNNSISGKNNQRSIWIQSDRCTIT